METSGYVVLRLLVGADGKLKNAHVLISSGVHALDRAAMRVTKEMVFKPAERAGVPVESWVRVPITFEAKPKKGWLYLRQAQALNADSVRAVGFQRIPDDLRESLLNATVALTLEVDLLGNVRKTALNQSSCLLKTDAAATELAKLLRFAPISEPGIERAQVNVTIAFQSDSVFLRFPGDTLLSDTVPRNPVGQVGIKPNLRNRAILARDIADAYPEDPSVTGKLEANVWILVDEAGNVARRQLVDTSGYCYTDLRILQAVRKARFDPALLDGQPQKVWVLLPVIVMTLDDLMREGL